MLWSRVRGIAEVVIGAVHVPRGIYAMQLSPPLGAGMIVAGLAIVAIGVWRLTLARRDRRRAP